MHNYLRSIGFSNLNTKIQEEKLIGSIIANPTTKKLVSVKDSMDNLYAEYTMEFAKGIGIKLCGTMDADEKFHMDNYFPFVEGRYLSSLEPVYVEKKIDSLAFSGLCEDNRVGISLIFQVNNPADQLGALDLEDPKSKLYLSGMSTEAMVILPTNNSFNLLNGNMSQKEVTKMVAEARNGEKEAIEKLAYAELDAYMDISNRLSNKEDIFSIVESSIMPYGMESDLYKMVGLITEVGVYENKELREIIYRLKVLCNDMLFDIVVNKRDIEGHVLAGMRFKGVVWLQGKVIFGK